MTEQELVGMWLLAGFSLMNLAEEIPEQELPTGNIDVREFRAILRNHHKPQMRSYLTTQHIPWLHLRGIPATPSPTEIDQALEFAIQDTTDLYETVALSTTTTATTAAVDFPLPRWRSIVHQAQILRDLARRAGDRLEARITRSLIKTPGLTGNRRWKTTSPDSRHAQLDGKVTPPSRGWLFEGHRVTAPRNDPSNPQEWSGCSCFVEYEYRSEDGSTGWL
jgi:hypothetical protein